ncbi:14008_t:CDS:10 [Ambispora leptoticha]|uniref:14008_t:CDS:1 n=1 Tax=Ambispora leptoticha TaxID=144679 RepID=A0A9N8V6H3_9GLOM|nr:14008_t:CDS:10 [Ambispora leptoticha]
MGKQEKSQLSKSRQEVNINWILSSSEPKPIGFFRLTHPTSRARAIENYRKCFDLAIKRSEGDKLSELRAMNIDEASIQRDWEIWLKKKKPYILACRANHDTGLRIQQDFTSTMADIVGIAGEIKSANNKVNDIEEHGNRKHQLDDEVLDNEIPVASVPSVTKKARSEDNDVDEEHEAIYIRAVHLAHKIEGSSISDISSSIDEESEADIKQNENMNKKDREDGHRPQNERDLENGLREASESMVGKVERTPLIVDDIDLEKIFKDYCDECRNNFDDIMDMRPTSRFTDEISEEYWDKFVLGTYPRHNISEEWENFIQEFFKPRDSLEEWKKAWRGLYEKIDGNKKDLVNVIYNILGPYIKAFEAPFNILRSGDLRENQYNAQFISPILENTMNTVCSIDWRILEIPVESSKARRNTVLEAKCADGLARLWQSHEEVFLYEQTGPPNFDDITQFHIHDYKLIRTMRDVLNQRIFLRLKNGIYDHKDLASFSAFGNRSEVSLFWLTIHQKSYCLREYGTFKIPSTWQELPVLSEAIITCLKFFSFMKENIEVKNSYIEQNQKLLAKRRVHSVKQNQSSPNRPKKRKSKK